MKPGIDPTVDCVFKALLGSEENKNLLIHFLNAVLEPPTLRRIDWVEILNPFNEREFLTDKLSTVDVKARDQRGTTFQIEIQLATYASLPDRILYGWADLYASQLKKGKGYDTLKPAVSIWVLARGVLADSPPFHHHLQMRDQVHGVVLGEDSGIHLVELEKWKKPRVEGELDRWTYFFKRADELDDESLPEGLDTQEMRQAMETLKMFSEKDRAYHAYQARMNFLREQNTILQEREAAQQQAEAARQQAEAARQQAEAEQRRAEAEQRRAEAEQRRAEAEQQRAEAEQQRAEAEQQRAEAAERQLEVARQQAERLLKLLREAGIDPGE